MKLITHICDASDSYQTNTAQLAAVSLLLLTYRDMFDWKFISFKASSSQKKYRQFSPSAPGCTWMLSSPLPIALTISFEFTQREFDELFIQRTSLERLCLKSGYFGLLCEHHKNDAPVKTSSQPTTLITPHKKPHSLRNEITGILNKA